MADESFAYADEVYTIIRAAFAVYNNLGIGFLEAVYQEALELELKKHQVPFESQKPLSIYYQGEELTKKYIADLVCWDSIIIELKVEQSLAKTDEAQIINYLKASGKQIGLLINFGNRRKLEWQRYIFTNTAYLKNNNIPNEKTL
ncbi:hypothetical protein McpSp1_08230 [Methanocorpusculaceae archaeon Sp1]|nr:hypothetical protein [Methanocorpusculaceae archaeon Sp1]